MLLNNCMWIPVVHVVLVDTIEHTHFSAGLVVLIRVVVSVFWVEPSYSSYARVFFRYKKISKIGRSIN